MTELKKKLEEASQNVLQWDEQIQEATINTGQLLFDKAVADTSFSEPIKGLKLDWEEMENQRKLLNNVQDSLNQLRETDQALFEKKKGLDKEHCELLSEIGREAFRCHKQKLFTDPLYGPIFDKLYKLEDRIQSADNDLYRIRSSVEKKGLWLKLNKSIQEKAHQTKKKSAGGSMVKQYGKTGEALLALSAFQDIFQEHLANLYNSYQRWQKAIESVEKEIQNNDNSRKTLLEQAGEENKGISKAIKNIEEQQEEIQSQLDHRFFDLGKDYWENDRIPQDWIGEIKLLKDLYDNMDEAKGLQEEIQLQISLDGLDKEKDSLKKKKEKKEMQMKELESSITQINEAISSLDREIKSIKAKLSRRKGKTKTETE